MLLGVCEHICVLSCKIISSVIDVNEPLMHKYGQNKLKCTIMPQESVWDWPLIVR